AAASQRSQQIWKSAFLALVDKNADGVMVVNFDGIICFVNPAAAELLGRGSDELVGQPFGTPIVPGEAAEIDLVRWGNPARTAEMRAALIEWQGEGAYLATLRDVTERKQFENEQSEAIRRRDEFLAMLSHELRNPLDAIANAGMLLKREDAPPALLRPARDVIERQCGQMKRLLDDLLDVTRISQGKIELRREAVDLAAVVDEAVEAVGAVLEEGGHHLDLQLPAGPVPVDGDAVRLQQVLVNLLTNAARYSDRGGRIQVVLAPEQTQAVLRVRDEGIGMSADELTRIFEPFVQAAQARSRAAGGLGVGLSLVRSLVELHGGTVTAHSKGPGLGSEFAVRLPLCRSGAPPLDVAAEDDEAASLRVLVVEDNADVRSMLKTLLELDGFEVEIAAEGRRAIELIETRRPDVALVDIGLPECDGYEVARRVRSDPRNAETYLVALTGYGSPQDRRRALDAGFDAHLSKPVDYQKLSAFISRAGLTPDSA
ncbi:MAG TPA: ATP-binding protein, partial [Planctomycetaceae bacterium]|nr:ATP-binding protein [Planctomycetaceae bacterium]